MFSNSNYLQELWGQDTGHFRVLPTVNSKSGSNPKSYYGSYEELQNQLQMDNENGFGIYYVVLNGGTKAYQIKANSTFNAVWVECDCPRDSSSGNYASQQIVTEYKEAILKKIMSTSFKPSFILDTRNGYHVVWFLNSNTTFDEWDHCMNRIAEYYNSDRNAMKLTQLLRVPLFNWTKTQDVYMCNPIRYSKERFDINDLINAYPPVMKSSKQVIKRKCLDTRSKELMITSTEEANNTVNSAYIRTHDIASLSECILTELLSCNEDRYENQDHNNMHYTYGPEKPTQNLDLIDLMQNGKVVSSNEEIHELISLLPIDLYLGLDQQKFSCILDGHNDMHPSASLYQHSDGNVIYSCFVCGVHTGIIGVTRLLQKSSEKEAYQFIKDLLKITDTQFHLPNEISNNNNLFIEQIENGALALNYPSLYKILKSRLSDLEMIIRYAERCYKPSNQISDTKYAFFLSRRTLKSMLGKVGNDRSNTTLLMLRLLGLLCEPEESQIPVRLLESANKKMDEQGFSRRTMIYTLSDFSHNELSRAESDAKYLIERGFKLSVLSQEWIYRSLDVSFVRGKFPTLVSNYSSLNYTHSDELTHKLSQIISDSIIEKGYALEKEVFQKLTTTYDRYLLKKQFGRSITEICETYGWERVRAKQMHKEKYRIPSKGYPFIIVRN